MKIAQLITSLTIGGAEKLVIESVPLYQKKGIEVDVITLSNKVTSFTEKLKKESIGNTIGLSGGSVYNPLLIFKLIKIINKYDLIHAHLFPVLYWVVIAKWLTFSNTKIIYTEHSTSNRRRKHFLLKKVDKLIYKGINTIVTISDEVDSKLKAHLKNNSLNFKMIHNGVDIEKFITAKPLSKSDFFESNDFVIIQVSSFRKEKDQATVIRAISLLPKKYKLLLVGDGHLMKENENLVEKLGLSERVKFLGVRNDVPNLLQMADVSVLSSFHEGLSLSCIEGMSVGPFIGSNVPGLGEVIRDSGILFEQGDYIKLSEIIKKLDDNKPYYELISKKCLDKVQSFKIDYMVDNYIDLYKNLLK